MSVSSTVTRNDYVGQTGSEVDFAFTYPVITPSADIDVIKRSTAGVETAVSYGSGALGWTVKSTTTVGETITGGVITLGTALEVDEILTLKRAVSMLQSADFRNQGEFYAASHEDAFDKSMMIDQQIDEKFDRTVRLPESIASEDFSTELPATIVDDDSEGMVLTVGDGTIVLSSGSTESVDNTKNIKLPSDVSPAAFAVELPSDITSSAGYSPVVNAAGDGFTFGNEAMSGVAELYGAYADWALPINAAFAAGYSVILPAGTLPLLTSIIPPYGSDGLSLKGKGRGATILQCDQAMDNGLLLDGDRDTYPGSPGLYRFNAEGFTIDGNSNATTGVRMTYCYHSTLRDVGCENATGNGLWIDLGFYNSFYDIRCVSNGIHGFLVGDTGNGNSIYSIVSRLNANSGLCVSRYGGAARPHGVNVYGGTLESNTLRQLYLYEALEVYVKGLYMEATGADWKTITDITSADPAVVTAASHGYANDDLVYIYDVDGCRANTVVDDINGRVFKVANETTHTFELKDKDGNDIDSTVLTDYVSDGLVHSRRFQVEITGGAQTSRACSVEGTTWDSGLFPSLYIGNAEETVITNNSFNFGITIDDEAEYTVIGPQARIEGAYSDRGNGTMCYFRLADSPTKYYQKYPGAGDVRYHRRVTGTTTELFAKNMILKSTLDDSGSGTLVKEVVYDVDLSDSVGTQTYTISNALPAGSLVYGVTALNITNLTGSNFTALWYGIATDEDMLGWSTANVTAGNTISLASIPDDQVTAGYPPWLVKTADDLVLKAKYWDGGAWDDTATLTAGTVRVVVYYTQLNVPDGAVV